MIPLVISFLFMAIYFYFTCTPITKPHIRNFMRSIINNIFRKYDWLFNKLLKNASRIMSVTLFLYIIYFFVYFFQKPKVDDFFDFIAQAATLIGFIALIEDRVKNK